MQGFTEQSNPVNTETERTTESVCIKQVEFREYVRIFFPQGQRKLSVIMRYSYKAGLTVHVWICESRSRNYRNRKLHHTVFLAFFFLEIRRKKNNLNRNNVKFNGASDKSLLTVCVDSML